MVAVRQWFPNKTAVRLAEILDCEVRSAERYLAGERTPGAEAVLKILRSDYGVRLITTTMRDLPPAEQVSFWKEMAKASKRRVLEAEMSRLERELDEADA